MLLPFPSGGSQAPARRRGQRLRGHLTPSDTARPSCQREPGIKWVNPCYLVNPHMLNPDFAGLIEVFPFLLLLLLFFKPPEGTH